jgi:hypothetical protein
VQQESCRSLTIVPVCAGQGMPCVWMKLGKKISDLAMLEVRSPKSVFLIFTPESLKYTKCTLSIKLGGS